MDIINKILSYFLSTPNGTGALIEEVKDYRNIQLGSFQKPVGAAKLTDVRGDEQVIEKMNFFWNQLSVGACVAHTIAMIFVIYIYKKTGKIIKISRRWLYKLCKMVDGFDGPGTYPRIAALCAVKDGFLTEDDITDDTSVGEKKYLDFTVTEEMRKRARQLTMPGFAYVDENIDALKEAIYQNGIAALGVPVGWWRSLPLDKGTNHHYIIAYRVEDIKNDYRIYIMNSWGKGWLAKIKNWLFPGRGYFLWSEYERDIFDIIVFTDIPKDILDKAQKAQYRFVKELSKGATDNSVIELQKFLNAEGFIVALIGSGSKGRETNYFGPATQNALIRWQEARGINPTGYFGPLSIAEANKRLPAVSLIDAIIQVESGGDDYAVGDTNLVHKAYGSMQIRQPAVDDVNKRFGTNYKAKDCLGNRGLSITIFKGYCEIYKAKTGDIDENKARLWNGGVGGIIYPSRTDGYWNKVKRLLNK